MAPLPGDDSDARCQQLSPAVYLYCPSLPPLANSSAPRLVILSSWVGAQIRTMSKYVAIYQKLYPTATVLVFLSSIRHCAWARDGRRAVAPATSVIRRVLGYPTSITKQLATVAPSDDNTATPKAQPPRLLIHIFSNGGSSMIHYLYEEYAATAFKSENDTDQGGLDLVLPPHVTVFDSAPSRFRYWGYIEAILPSAPGGPWVRRAVTPLVHWFCLVMLIRQRLLGAADSSALWARSHNDKFRVLEAARLYMYSKEDKTVHWRDVEDHADKAKAQGFDIVSRERFTGSQHVSHARIDPERYWRLVTETWARGVKRDLVGTPRL